MTEQVITLKSKKESFRINNAVLGYILIIPALLCIAVVALYPVFQTFRLSLYDMKLQFISDTNFVGMANYINLFQDYRFLLAAWNTLRFTVISVSLELILGIIMALLMNKKFKGIGVVRAAVLVPWAIPTIVSALMWKFIFHDQFGVLNDILSRLGIIGSYQAWLGTPLAAMGAAICVDVWKTSPFMGLLILAGLQNIPDTIYEAAKVDGANNIKCFFRIILPMLKPTIMVALIFRTLDAFRVFDLLFVLTGGGPGNSTETFVVYAYKTLFRNLDFGLGSAMAVIIFLCLFTLAMLYIRFLDKSILKQGEN